MEIRKLKKEKAKLNDWTIKSRNRSRIMKNYYINVLTDQQTDKIFIEYRLLYSSFATYKQ